MPGHLSVEGELNIFDRFAITDRLRLFNAYERRQTVPDGFYPQARHIQQHRSIGLARFPMEPTCRATDSDQLDTKPPELGRENQLCIGKRQEL